MCYSQQINKMRDLNYYFLDYSLINKKLIKLGNGKNKTFSIVL